MKKQNEFVPYYRVSKPRQGINGLGMDAQRYAVRQFLNSGNGKTLAEFAEVESRRRNDRPELAKAIALCRKSKATLVIAKLDRLSGNTSFLFNLRDSGVDFVCCDCPHADRFTVGILALCAEREVAMVSQRTKDALAAAKRKGIKLGNPKLAKARKAAIQSTRRKAQDFADTLQPIIKEIEGAGITTQRGIAQCLNARGFKTAMGQAFAGRTVARIQRRLA